MMSMCKGASGKIHGTVVFNSTVEGVVKDALEETTFWPQLRPTMDLKP